jgi:hypothetical protein
LLAFLPLVLGRRGLGRGGPFTLMFTVPTHDPMNSGLVLVVVLVIGLFRMIRLRVG